MGNTTPQAGRETTVKIAVHTLGSEPTRLEADLSPSELDPGEDESRFGQPVHVVVKLTRMQEDILAQGEARTTVRLECSRCLDEVDVQIAGSFEALYAPEARASGQQTGRRDFEWGSRGVSFYGEGSIDLTDEIRQCLVIELPLKPLCRPDCSGLCPQCGQNLNERPCDCKADADASPWAALRDLIPPKE